MKQWIIILSGLLSAQLVLAVVLNLTGEDYGTFQAEESLLSFNRQAVDGASNIEVATASDNRNPAAREADQNSDMFYIL